VVVARTNRFRADTNVCPVCRNAGVFAVPNDEALRLTVLTVSFELEIPRHEVHRKNIFYPDAPKITSSRNTTNPRRKTGFVEFELIVGGFQLPFSCNFWQAGSLPTMSRPHHRAIWRKTWQLTAFRPQQRRDFNRAGVRCWKCFRAGHHERIGLMIISTRLSNSSLRKISELRHGKRHGALRRERFVRPIGQRIGAKLNQNMNSFSGVRARWNMNSAQDRSVKRGEKVFNHAPLE